MLKKNSSTTGGMYEVMLDGTKFIIKVRAERLTLFETESESESRSTSNPTKTTTNKRFVEVQSDDLLNFVNQQKNRNTLSKLFYDLKLLTSFLHQETINEHRPIYQIPPKELCTLLYSYERHLRNHNYEYLLTKSVEFAKLREVLTSKQRELKRQGLGNLKNRPDAVTDEDIEKQWECQQMGSNTPESIINTIWF